MVSADSRGRQLEDQLEDTKVELGRVKEQLQCAKQQLASLVSEGSETEADEPAPKRQRRDGGELPSSEEVQRLAQALSEVPEDRKFSLMFLL